MFFETVLCDARYGARSLWKDRLFSSVAILTLALGMGANTTMFSVVNSVLLRPLPGFETDRIVRIGDTDARYRAGFIPPQLYLEIAKHSRSFETVAGQQFCPFSLTGAGDAEQVFGPCTTANWFTLQHAGAMLGRTFASDEDQHGNDKVVILGNAFWHSKFNGDGSVIGRAIRLNGAPWTVIGVMPPDFKPLGVSDDVAIYTPDVVTENPSGLIVMARLKHGVSIDAARAELRVLGDNLARSQPGAWKGTGLTLTPALEDLTGDQRPLLSLLMGAVGFVLLIACANVSSLLLARSKARQHETQIRIAVGASPSRIARFLLTEVLLICSVASVLAVAIAYGGTSALRPLLESLPRAQEIGIDNRVFLCALILGWVATLLAGAMPIGRSYEPRARMTLRGQTSLLAAEVALTLTLLVGAGLLIRSFINLRSARLGYDPSNTITSLLALPESSSAASAELLYGRIREQLASLPGVRSVATASSTPAGGVDMSIDVQPEGHAERKTAPATATVNMVSADYFRTLGIELKAGRAFADTDRQGAAPVVIVSESIARKYFGSKAVGKRVRVPAVNFALTDAKMIWAEIVGVANSVAVTSAGETTAEHIYLSEAQSTVRFTYILLKANKNATSFIPALRKVVREQSPTTPLDEIKTMDERTAYLTSAPKRWMWLLGLFAGLASLLSSTGTYAVSAYLSAQRSKEMAIRKALGADVLSLLGAASQKPVRSIMMGIMLGIAASAGLTRFLASQLYGIGHIDVITYAAATVALLMCAVLAMLGPTLKAVRTDVANALREE